MVTSVNVEFPPESVCIVPLPTVVRVELLTEP